jgi:hypothetical protein
MKNLKPAEILMRLTAQLGNGTLSRTLANDWSNSLEKAEQGLKICEDCTFYRKGYGQGFLEVSRRLIHLLSDITTTNQRSYSRLVKDRVKLAFCSKRRGRKFISAFLLHDNARLHTAAVTKGTLKELHWEILPHPTYSPDLAPSDFHVFDPLKEALGGKKLMLTFCVMMAGRSFFKRGIMKLPEGL